MALITKIKIAVIIAALFFVCSIIWYFSLSSEKVKILVQKGDSASKVATLLKKNNLVYSRNLFLVIVRATGSSSKIKAGVYEFSQRGNVFSILHDLRNPPNDVVRVTVPEGSNIIQIADIMAEKLENFDRDNFIAIAKEQQLEGYLLPETYLINPAFNERDVISIMRGEFDKRITTEMQSRAREMGFSMKNIVILASIIEKEAVKDEERAIISSVFHNRLRQRIKLESCATVLYAMGKVKPRLTTEDTKFDSPYNTYQHYGLPPGPIASPGIRAIEAALYPADTDKLFFVASGDGGHLFANGFKQHIENKLYIENNKSKGSKKK
jgi:UPF0755 protein